MNLRKNKKNRSKLKLVSQLKPDVNENKIINQRIFIYINIYMFMSYLNN